MISHNVKLTPAEWSVMECLWENSPLTGRELTELMHESCTWNRSTTLTLLRRMEAKKAVISDNKSGVKLFRPLIHRGDAALQETKDFLGRVYKGSLSLMVSSITQKQALPKEEIDKLYALLEELEAGGDD